LFAGAADEGEAGVFGMVAIHLHYPAGQTLDDGGLLLQRK